MKKTIIAAALLVTTGFAQADTTYGGMTFVSGSSAAIANDPFNPLSPSLLSSISEGVLIDTGRLQLNNAVGNWYQVTYTYLGSESGYNNIFHNFSVGGSKLFEGKSYAIGSSVSAATNANGYLNFAFEGSNGNFANNYTGVFAPYTSVGLIGSNMNVGNNHYSFVLGYNDSATVDTDFDDFVIGVNIAPIPEPETYAMLLAGLGLMGFVARRRKQRAG